MKRPINLDLTTFSYPPMAIVSILHRMSGILLFILLPMILCFVHKAIVSEDAFIMLKTSLIIKFIFWVFASALAFHIVAGIRHIIMDAGYGEGLQVGRKSAVAVMVTASILIILLGIWIW